MAVTAKVAERIAAQVKRYQGILAQAQQRDVGESDTSLIISDMLSDVFGYSKYEHITTEHAIRGTYADLAVQVADDLRFLIEVKAIGVSLKDQHVKQAVDYAANKGTEWVILTNGAIWRVYKIIFAQPIDKTLIWDLDLLNASAKSSEVLECLGCLSREGFSKGSMTELIQQKQVTGKFAVASVLTSDPMIAALRKELRRLIPGLKVDAERLKTTVTDHVIKRELVDSDEAKTAQAFVKKLMRAIDREREKKLAASPADAPAAADPFPVAASTQVTGDPEPTPIS